MLPWLLLTLPVEVLAATKREVPVKFSLTAAQVQRSERVWLKIHGLTFPQQASLRLNGGAYLPLNNATAALEGPGKHYGGIGGPISTHTLSLPVTGLLEGSNTLRFRFNGTDGVSSGFRVIGWNLLDAGGSQVIPASAFKVTDPKYWAAYSTDPAYLAEGKRLWEEAPLLKNPLEKVAIRAKCGDCHAKDGRDLKYFGYSNAAIVERWKHHRVGLVSSTQATAEGKKVASYIRRLPVPVLGRPWNPPYQPGPGLDAKPVSHWAAGAGLGAVLKQDRDLLPFLLTPGGLNLNPNLRELPIGFLLPTWDRWLCRVHPLDAGFPEASVSDLLVRYEGLRGGFSGDVTFGYRADGFQAQHYQWGGQIRALLLASRPDPARDPNADRDPRSEGWTPALAERMHSLRQWELVKLWELHHEFGLEEKGAAFKPAARAWQSLEVWQAAPHESYINQGMPISASPAATDPNYAGFSASYNYFCNAWFHLQFILNDSGNVNAGMNGGGSMEYCNQFAARSVWFGDQQPVRNTALFLKHMGLSATALAPKWDLRFSGPWQLDPFWPEGWQQLTLAEQKAILGPVFEAWIAKNRSSGYRDSRGIPNVQWTLETWQRNGVSNGSGVDWAKGVWPSVDWERYRN